MMTDNNSISNAANNANLDHSSTTYHATPIDVTQETQADVELRNEHLINEIFLLLCLLSGTALGVYFGISASGFFPKPT
jgi:hypothetical protein